MFFSSKAKPAGNLGVHHIRNTMGFWGLVRFANPFATDSKEARRWRFRQLRRTVPQLVRYALVLAALKVTRAVLMGGRGNLMTGYGALVLTVIRKDGSRVQLGLAGIKAVTDAGVAAIVDGLDSGTMAAFDYQGIGTNNTAEDAGDTDLNTEITTEYTTNSTRPTGTISQPSANIFQNLATVGVDASVAAVEAGVFDNATVGSGTLLDRTVFATVNLANGDSLQLTYQLTLSSGG